MLQRIQSQEANTTEFNRVGALAHLEAHNNSVKQFRRRDELWHVLTQFDTLWMICMLGVAIAAIVYSVFISACFVVLAAARHAKIEVCSQHVVYV